MKKFILIILATAICTGIFAQDSVYFRLMEETVKLADSAKTFDDWVTISNTMQRISDKESDEWLPLYYLSMSNLMCGLLAEDKKDQESYYEKALEIVEKCKTKSDIDSSEVLVLNAFVLQMQISLKPAKLGKTLGPISEQALKDALRINPENPRAYMLRGENLYYTPPMFGGDKEKALDDFRLAKEKFEKFEPKSSIHPRWGYEYTLILIKKCESGE